MNNNKTYALGVLAVLLGALSVPFPEIRETLQIGLEPGDMVTTGLALIFVRHGIAKSGL